MIDKWIVFNNTDLPTGKIKEITIVWANYLKTYQLQIRVQLFNKSSTVIRIDLENNSEDYYIQLLRGSIGVFFDNETEVRDYLSTKINNDDLLT
ncbi:hypothetical protein [Flammeovirga sp. SubArs3]|uniref:hypothetical protein n=1 Tax=Flammeovirga sp. SubArs3 TaxID=2995316 RepID=UPI00248CB785|nr:hypothetical protein [Flammeovirga sp. SubArs3]